jgi:hypothetical protein
MPLTKVRYDMLDSEITQKISDAGSPLVFDKTGAVETLSKFKVDGVLNNVRDTDIVGGKLVITLATFTPAITVAGQTNLAWDVAATTFNVNVDNPTSDYPDQWISELSSMEQKSGSVVTDLTKYTKSGFTAFPLTASGDFNTTFTTNSGSGSYIRPVISLTDNNTKGPATGGSASAEITFKNDTTNGDPADWLDTKYTWTTTWQNVSHSIAHAALSGKTFLKTYANTAVTLTVNGLNDPTKASCTLTPTGGTISGFNSGDSGDRAAQLDFTVPICKDNAGSTRSVSLATVFSRPIAVTGTAYTYTPSPATTNSTVSASFTYPSFTTWTANSDTAPSAADLVDDSTANGFVSDTAVIPHMFGDEVGSMSYRAITNNGASRIFWFCVRGTHTSTPSITTGNETLPIAVLPANIYEKTFTLKPSTTPTGWTSDVTYRAWGILLNPGTTYVSFSGA